VTTVGDHLVAVTLGQLGQLCISLMLRISSKATPQAIPPTFTSRHSLSAIWAHTGFIEVAPVVCSGRSTSGYASAQRDIHLPVRVRLTVLWDHERHPPRGNRVPGFSGHHTVTCTTQAAEHFIQGSCCHARFIFSGTLYRTGAGSVSCM
jgi:hypothetical protein